MSACRALDVSHFLRQHSQSFSTSESRIRRGRRKIGLRFHVESKGGDGGEMGDELGDYADTGLVEGGHRGEEKLTQLYNASMVRETLFETMISNDNGIPGCG